MKENLYVLVPAWNEEKAIGGVIQELKDSGYNKIIVVDDGSKDMTFKVASSYNEVYALRHIVNRGKGAAIETAIEMAKRLGAETVVLIDGDGQHNPKDIEKMYQLYKEGYDVILGSRLIKSKGMPFTKIVQNKIGNLLVYMLYGLWVSDSQSGFRMFSRKAIDLIDIKVVDRYAFDSEVIREIYRHSLKYIEVPIEVRYTEYSQGKTGNKQTLFNGIKMFFKMILSI